MQNHTVERSLPVLAATAILIISAGLAGCSTKYGNPSAERSDLDTVNNVMSFIGQHHKDAAAFINNHASYAQTGSSGKGTLGYSSITYTGDGWTVSIGHAVVPDYINDIKVDYGNGKIVWTGAEKNGQIIEVSYTKTG